MAISEIIFAAQSASGLVEVIRWIIQIGSSIAVGIILFTLLLKLITLPFDAVSKVQMRKNSLIMENMREDLEKLQKQYAGDKQLYNQKMMALYKKNGYSMFGACLPMIITLVIFIVAINSFTDYSRYQNKYYFWEMSKAYNNAVYQGLVIDGDYIKENEKYGTLDFNHKEIIKSSAEEREEKGYTLILDSDSNGLYYEISSGGYTSYKQYYSENEGEISVSSGGTYYIDSSKLSGIEVKGKTYANYAEEGKTAADFISDLGSVYSAEKYHEQIKSSSFLWIKNIWVADSPLAHPVESSWDKFVSSYQYKETDDKERATNMGEGNYSLLIANLQEEQTTQNGYFILPVITAGMAFLVQFITSRSQKAAMELQTVNGQGAQQQKIMMIMMPVMMAFFAFMYTAAFSIYMILSQFISVIFTLVINKVIDAKFKKKAQAEGSDKIRGRIYVPETPVQDKKGKNAAKEDQGPDFIKGGKTHVRGRLK